MNDHWLDRIARHAVAAGVRDAPSGEPALTRGTLLGKAAAAALALSGLRALAPTRANAAQLACPAKNRAACQRTNYAEYRAYLRQSCDTIDDRLFASKFRCLLEQHHDWQFFDRRCRRLCPPPKPPTTKPPAGGGGGSKPPQPPSGPADPCGACTYYCNPCAAVSSGYICCIYDLKFGKNPCCP